MDTNVRAIYLDIGGRRAGGRGSGRTRRSRRRRWHSLHVSSIVSHPLPSPPSADTHTHQIASVKPKKPTPLYTARQNRPSMPVFPPYPATDKAYVCVCVPVLCSCRRRCRRRCARVQIQYYSALPPHVVCAREQHTHAHAHTYTLYQKTKASSSGLVGARRSDGSGDGGGALAHVARKSITERSPHALSESAAKTRIRVHTFLYHVHAFRRRRRRCPPSRWYVENPAPSPPPPPPLRFDANDDVCKTVNVIRILRCGVRRIWGRRGRMQSVVPRIFQRSEQRRFPCACFCTQPPLPPPRVLRRSHGVCSPNHPQFANTSLSPPRPCARSASSRSASSCLASPRLASPLLCHPQKPDSLSCHSAGIRRWVCECVCSSV